MIFSLLIAATVVLVLMIVGLSFLVFGREWLFARREKRFLLALGGHSGLFTRLQSTSAEEFTWKVPAALSKAEVKSTVPKPDPSQAVPWVMETISRVVASKEPS